MRIYVPQGWDVLANLQLTGSLPGPLRGCAVDPAWRAAAADVDEEEWEYQAAEQAADALDPGGGLVLAVDVPAEVHDYDDGWVVVPGPVHRRQIGALLDGELAWFGLQELAGLLADAGAQSGQGREKGRTD